MKIKLFILAVVVISALYGVVALRAEAKTCCLKKTCDCVAVEKDCGCQSGMPCKGCECSRAE